jgi:hypothetical protein
MYYGSLYNILRERHTYTIIVVDLFLTKIIFLGNDGGLVVV